MVRQIHLTVSERVSEELAEYAQRTGKTINDIGTEALISLFTKKPRIGVRGNLLLLTFLPGSGVCGRHLRNKGEYAFFLVSGINIVSSLIMIISARCL